MANVLIDEQTMKAIGNAIRSLTGESSLILPADMPMQICSVSAVADAIALEDIVSYYQEPTQSVVDELNKLNDDYVSFIIITDSHGNSNKQNSQNIARYILKNSKANRLFHLGDMSSNLWSETEYEAYFAPLIYNCNSKLFFALGNHELFNASINDVTVIYQDILSNKTYLKGSPDNFYYYFDDTARKIRYLVINTSDGIANGVTNTQLSWIKESVKLSNKDWKLIVFGHIDIMPNDPITGEWQSLNASQITEALSSTNGVIIGYFCGHEHIDRIVKVNDKFYQVTLLNDSCVQETSFSEIITPTRTAGTISEQAVSVVSINIVTGDVTIRRIGAGENMSYNYLPETIQATGVSLDKTELTFVDSTNQTLIATVEPSNSTDAVIWESSNTSVASVKNGVVSPVSNGSCVITAKAGNYSASCDVTVDIEGEIATISSISATYTGGDVPIGTALTDLTGITVIATYSDGTTEEVTGYTLSGTIAEGSNIITVTHGDLSTTFTVKGISTQFSGTDAWYDGVTYNLNIIDDEYVETDGSIETYSGWSRSDYMYCKGAAEIRGVPIGIGNCYFKDYTAFYDENKNYISSMNSINKTDDYYYTSVPENACYFMLSEESIYIKRDNYSVYPSATNT